MRALALNCYIRAENIDIGKELENNRLLREYFDMIKSEYSKKMNHAEKNP